MESFQGIDDYLRPYKLCIAVALKRYKMWLRFCTGQRVFFIDKGQHCLYLRELCNLLSPGINHVKIPFSFALFHLFEANYRRVFGYTHIRWHSGSDREVSPCSLFHVQLHQRFFSLVSQVCWRVAHIYAYDMRPSKTDDLFCCVIGQAH